MRTMCPKEAFDRLNNMVGLSFYIPPYGVDAIREACNAAVEDVGDPTPEEIEDDVNPAPLVQLDPLGPPSDVKGEGDE